MFLQLLAFTARRFARHFRIPIAKNVVTATVQAVLASVLRPLAAAPADVA